jgi:hypothetical protein
LDCTVATGGEGACVAVIGGSLVAVIAIFDPFMNVAVTAVAVSTIVETGIRLDGVPVIAFFNTLPNDAVTAPGRLALVRALVGRNIVTVITRLPGFRLSITADGIWTGIRLLRAGEQET